MKSLTYNQSFIPGVNCCAILPRSDTGCGLSKLILESRHGVAGRWSQTKTEKLVCIPL